MRIEDTIARTSGLSGIAIVSTTPDSPVYVARCPRSTISQRAEADSQFIVRAANFHDELILALEGCLVALHLGFHVDKQAAMEYGLDILLRAKGVKNEGY